MEYTYDPLMRLKSILAKDPAQNPVITRQYTYSPIGNITAKETEHGTYTYQYDDLYQLTNADNPSIADEAYTYDLLGNRLSSAAATGNWTYNVNNELTGYGNTAFQYDANGNTTNKTNGTNITNYIYDAENRLVEVKDGNDAVTATYYYDPFGRRLWKDVAGQKTYFLYADEGLIGEYDASGAEQRAYGYAPDSVWSTNPLFQKVGGEYYWYQNDHNGTPQKLTTTSGAVVWSATYDAFGNCQVDTEEITNNLRFAGQYYDAETGLHYNWHRYYDPTTGRYLQTDPFGDGLNLYAYCFNNPNSLIDPLGLCAIKSIIGENLVKFFKGAGEALFTSVYELLATVYDIEQLLIYNFTGSFEATSGLFKALNSGVSVGELLLGMAEGIIDVPIEYCRAIASGDPERIGAATFNFAALIYAAGKTGKGIKAKFKTGAVGRDISKASKGTALSPYRYTQAGETFQHYGYTESAESLAKGLNPGSYGTTVKGLTGVEAQKGLALPHENPPTAVYTVSPPPETLIRVNPITRPQFGQPGGLPEVEFVLGTPPGSVSGPKPIPRGAP